MFLQHRNLNRAAEPFVLIPVTAAESYTPGEVLTVKSGGATKCGGTDKPLYICQQTLANAPEDAVIHCTVINAMQELEAPLEADGASLKVGDKVTVGTDGLTVTATTEGGVFLITAILGTAVGDPVRGFFVPADAQASEAV